MGSTLFIIIIVVIAILGLFVIPRFMMKRATNHVLKIFRQHYATSVKSARTVEELGLKPRTFMEGMFRNRDYKPHALQLLMKSEIIQMTEDGKLYLSEERLASSGLYMR